MKKTADIHFNADGVPVSNQFDDIYFSVDSGIDESQYVFLEHNGLPQDFSSLPANYEFVVTETGFGTGLNFLLCWQSFLQHAPENCRLVFVSFEKFPLTIKQLEKAYESLPSLRPFCQQLLDNYPSPEPGCHRLLFAEGRVTLDLWIGDINNLLPDVTPQLQHQVDRWFLDGFAPSKNPQMWSETLFNAMAVTAHRQTRYATFTAAGVVKNGLRQAGFAVEKVKGFGRKRDMLRGHFVGAETTQQALKKPLNTDPVTIIGAGIAGASLALALHYRGVKTTVVSSAVANGASGNPQGAVYPLLHAEHTPLSTFYLQAFSTAYSFYLPWRQQQWFPSAVLQPAFNAQRQQRAERLALSDLYQDTTVQLANRHQSQQQAHLELGYDALVYPRAGWLRPQMMVQSLLEAANSTIEYRHFDGAEYTAEQRYVVAAGHLSKALLPDSDLKLQPVRGQISLVKATPQSQSLDKVLCYKGYMIPADDGVHCIGATFNRGSDDSTLNSHDDQENLDNLSLCAQQPWAEGFNVVGSRCSIRATSPDHQPTAGAINDHIWVFTTLGSRGLTAAPVVAELLAAELTGGVKPLSEDAIRRLSPHRFGSNR